MKWRKLTYVTTKLHYSWLGGVFKLSALNIASLFARSTQFIAAIASDIFGEIILMKLQIISMLCLDIINENLIFKKDNENRVGKLEYKNKLLTKCTNV